MKCPHCLVEFHDRERTLPIGTDKKAYWQVVHQDCPVCRNFVIHLSQWSHRFEGGKNIPVKELKRFLVHPKGIQRPPPPPEVDEAFADDYREACLVFPDSPKASAALSRRCLQHVLREVAKVKHSDLSKEIQEVLDRGTLPSHIAESLDAVRNIGNLAAHPLKDKSTGEVVEVEPGEAEWNLDVLEALFDHYFVQPAIMKKKRDALNTKLAAAGKPAMK